MKSYHSKCLWSEGRICDQVRIQDIFPQNLWLLDGDFFGALANKNSVKEDKINI